MYVYFVYSCVQLYTAVYTGVLYYLLGTAVVGTSTSTKDKWIQIYPQGTCRKQTRHRPADTPADGVSGLRAGATECPGHGADIRSPKSCFAAEWLAAQNNSSSKRSDSDQQLLTTSIDAPY